MPGRPRALDEFKRREICAIVAAGGGLDGAARYVGCNVVTIRRETMRDPDFLAQLRQAELESQLSPLKTVQKAAATHWRAAAWFLERTQPNRFTLQVRGRYTEDQLQQSVEAIGCAILDKIDDYETAVVIMNAISEAARQYHLEVRAMDRMFRDVGSRRQRMLQAKSQSQLQHDPQSPVINHQSPSQGAA